MTIFLKNVDFLVDLEYLFIFVLMVGNVISRCGELFPDVFRPENFQNFHFFDFFGSMEINENQWKSMEINENQWKSMDQKNIKSSKIKNFQKFQNFSQTIVRSDHVSVA